MYQKTVIEDAWDRAVGRDLDDDEEAEKAKAEGAAKAKAKPDPVVRLDLTWYEGTRHSFVSRNLSRGASLDEVSAAVGHANVTTTRRYYDHFVRKTFSSTLTRGLGLGAVGDPAPVLPLHGAGRSQPADGDDQVPGGGGTGRRGRAAAPGRRRTGRRAGE